MIFLYYPATSSSGMINNLSLFVLAVDAIGCIERHRGVQALTKRYDPEYCELQNNKID
jgi:hypothetical protein